MGRRRRRAPGRVVATLGLVVLVAPVAPVVIVALGYGGPGPLATSTLGPFTPLALDTLGG
jgi:hypothetical protein